MLLCLHEFRLSASKDIAAQQDKEVSCLWLWWRICFLLQFPLLQTSQGMQLDLSGGREEQEANVLLSHRNIVPYADTLQWLKKQKTCWVRLLGDLLVCV